MSTAMVLELSEGCELVIDGEPWQVERLEPCWGKVTLRSGDGTAGRRERQPAMWKDLARPQQQLLELRLAHLLEAETGFRSPPDRGSPAA